MLVVFDVCVVVIVFFALTSQPERAGGFACCLGLWSHQDRDSRLGAVCLCAPKRSSVGDHCRLLCLSPESLLWKVECNRASLLLLGLGLVSDEAREPGNFKSENELGVAGHTWNLGTWQEDCSDSEARTGAELHRESVSKTNKNQFLVPTFTYSFTIRAGAGVPSLEVETGGSQVQGMPGLQNKFKTTLETK